jgi:hypothetical protein
MPVVCFSLLAGSPGPPSNKGENSVPFPSILRRAVPTVALATTAALSVGAAPSAFAQASAQTRAAMPCKPRVYYYVYADYVPIQLD